MFSPPPPASTPEPALLPLPLRCPARLRALCWLAAAVRVGFLGFALGGLAGCGALLAGWTLRLGLAGEGMDFAGVLSWTLLVFSWGAWLGLAALLFRRSAPEEEGVLISLRLQPGLAEVVKRVCALAGQPEPDEVWVRVGVEARWQRVKGQRVLRVGLALVRLLGPRELAAVLLEALLEAEAAGLRRPLALLGGEAAGALDWRRWARRPARAWCGSVAATVLGSESWELVRRKRSRLERAWADWRSELEEGRDEGTLPENAVRRLARMAMGQVDESEGELGPAGAGEGGQVEQALAGLPEGSSSAAMVRGFDLLGRQVTQAFYRQALGGRLGSYRILSEALEERQERDGVDEAALGRYFGGLAHPERAVFGLARTSAGAVEAARLRAEIERVRREGKVLGESLRPLLERWNAVWLRRRDLEAAAALSQAGLEVCALKLGVTDTRWTALLTEAGRMKQEMEQAEPVLQHLEAELERRFAAALGLLWWADEVALSAPMRERRRLLPTWVAVFEAMAQALPLFRETLTEIHTLQTLAARVHEASDSGGCLAVLHHLVPRLLNQARQIRAALDGALYPEADTGSVIPLADFLFAEPIPESPLAWLQGTEDLGLQERVFQLASDAAQFMTPFADRYLLVYHHAYAWLAETAERAELSFVDRPACTAPPVATGRRWFGRSAQSRARQERQAVVVG